MKQSLEKLNIAITHDWITNVAGAERVLLAILELFPKSPVYTAVFDKEKAKPFLKYDIRTSFLQKIPLIRGKKELLIPFAPFAFEQFDLSEYDIVISSSTFASKGVITRPGTINICYCNTPPRYIWETEIDPRGSGGSFSWIRKITAHKLRIWDRNAADRVDHYFGNSNYIVSRIKKYYQRDAVTLYPSVDIEKYQIAPKENIKDYFLFVSRLVGYKKCDIVIQAFNKLGLPLKIIGKGPEKSSLQKMAKKNIEFLDFVSDEVLKKYYEEARGFIFAAEEDFGIVPVEAMAAGRPVIAYGKGGATETVIDGTSGIFFNEQTPESLIEAVKKFNQAVFDPTVIKKTTEKFSKQEFQKQLVAGIENFLNSSQKQNSN